MHNKAIRLPMPNVMTSHPLSDDPLAPARGLMIGSGICLVFWSAVAAAILL